MDNGRFLIVDDTPGVVVVSAFDPVRREVARRALERLIQDGRIHPGRIEEIVEEITADVERDIMEAARPRRSKPILVDCTKNNSSYSAGWPIAPATARTCCATALKSRSFARTWPTNWV